MGVIGQPREFFDEYRFRVEIDQFRYALFSKCSELTKELAIIEHSEGGSAVPDKSPGRLKVENLTLEQGATTDLEIYDWFEQVINVSAGIGGTGLTGGRYRRQLDVVALGRDERPVQRWRCVDTWPFHFTAGKWDNESDKKVITVVKLAMKDFYPVTRYGARG